MGAIASIGQDRLHGAYPVDLGSASQCEQGKRPGGKPGAVQHYGLFSALVGSIYFGKCRREAST
jgi:hypothetical protein